MTAMFALRLPDVSFQIREQTDQSPGSRWTTVTSGELFAGKRVGLFALPGAFTPTCSSTHLPGFEYQYHDLINNGLDEVYCLSVNDSFVMNAWFRSLNIHNVKALPDGSANFTRQLGMLVKKDNLGFGLRSWRYSLIAQDQVIEKLWIEPGYRDDADDDPFQVSDARTMLEYLIAKRQSAAR